MRKIDFDESKMSISSDDMNPVERTQEKVHSRCTKKCLIGIIVLGCLILSILIALDVISLKKIINIRGSDTKKQNKQNLQVQNQITQEKKPESSNQEIEENKKIKREEKKAEDKEEKKEEDKNDKEEEDKNDKKEADKNDKEEEDKNDKKEDDKNDKEEDDKKDKKEEDKNDKEEEDDDKKKKEKEKDKDKNEKEEEKNEEDKDKKENDKEEDEENKKIKKNEDKDKKEKEKENADDDKDEEKWKKDYDKNQEKDKDLDDDIDDFNGIGDLDLDDDKELNDIDDLGSLHDKDYKDLNDFDGLGDLDDIDDKQLDDFDGLGNLDDNAEKELDDFDGLGDLDDIDDKQLDDFDGLGNLDDNIDDKELDDFDGLGNLDDIDDKQLDDFDGLGDLDDIDDSELNDFDGLGDLDNVNDDDKELDDLDGLGDLDDIDDKQLDDFDGLGDLDKVKEEENEGELNTTIEAQESERVIKKNFDTSNGNVGLNPNYKGIDPNDEEFTYVPIVGIDDVHGLFFPKINKVKIDNDILEYKTGGLEYVTKYLNILRKDFGSGRVLYFDGGDFYQGGIDSVLFDGEIMIDFYNLIGINGTTIGNHEFDYSRSWIENKIENGSYTWLINNIKDNGTNKVKGALGKKHDKSKIYKVKLPNNDTIKIGVIGITFNMKNDKTMPNTWGNRNTWDNISFYPYIEKLEKESKALRKKGAVAVLALVHFGLVCNQTLAMKLDMYNKSSIQGKCLREDDDSVMFKLTDKLKPGIIDGIIGGDTHMEMHHWENDIPLMSTPTHARYINIMYLPFKKNESGDYYLVNDEIKIEGPLPACEKIFENYQNCELISAKEYIDAGKLINYKWRGEQIETDKSVQKIYDKYYERFKSYAEQDIVSFEGFDKIKVDKSGDCTLCNTYLDAIVDIKKADFAIINRGIFPEELVPGTLTRAEFYNQMPYLDKICTVDVTGRELKDIVETVQSVGKSFYPSSNLKQTIKIDENGVKTVTNVELYVNGTLTQIDDNQIYKMASSLFVLSETSGEDFAKGKSYEVIHAKAMDKKVTCSNVTIDNEMSEYFKGKGVIDLSKKVDPEKPRIFIEK